MNNEFVNRINILNAEHYQDGYAPNLLYENKMDELATSKSSSTSILSSYQQFSEDHEKLLVFVCGMCGVQFAMEADYNHHLENIHDELKMSRDLNIIILTSSDAECLVCGVYVKHNKLLDLQKHYLLHLQHKPYKCKCHGFFFHERSTAMAHINCRHSRLSGFVPASTNNVSKIIHGRLAPAYANDVLLDNGKLTFEKERPETSIGYRCSECGEHLPDEESWKQHCNEAHDFKTLEGLNMTRFDVGSVRCNECSAIISGKWDNYKLRRHKLTHSPFKAFYCLICKYSRKRKDDVLHHIRQSHVPPIEKYS